MASRSFEARSSRRRWLGDAAGLLLSLAMPAASGAEMRTTATLWTFGDSVLDCGHYNDERLDPGRLLVRNDDRLFPEFRGLDLSSRGPARLAHHAVDGSTVDGLAAQLPAAAPDGPGFALLSVGGNDLLRGLVADTGPGVRAFEATLRAFVHRLPVRPLLIATVYDPTFGDDRRNFLGVDARIARANHGRVNDAIRGVAADAGRLVDLHAHFLRGDPSWFTHTIEPSLRGASEVRRVFAEAMELR